MAGRLQGRREERRREQGRREERRREQGRREERRREEGRREERRREQRRKQRKVEEEREAESIIFGSGECGVGSGMIFTPHSPLPIPHSLPTRQRPCQKRKTTSLAATP